MAQAAQGGGEVIVSGGVQNRVDVVLRDSVGVWWGWAGVGLGGLSGLFQP